MLIKSLPCCCCEGKRRAYAVARVIPSPLAANPAFVAQIIAEAKKMGHDVAPPPPELLKDQTVMICLGEASCDNEECDHFGPLPVEFN